MSSPPAPTRLLEHHLSVDRLSTYVQVCDGNLAAALELYDWNTAIAGAFWESLGNVEVLLRNTMHSQLALRHHLRGRPGSWLDDPARELGERTRIDIAQARNRARQKGKAASEGQLVSELSFGFWRFLITRRLTNLWPDLATGFAHAADRRRETVEEPVARTHEFRNRIAHHQRIWNQPLAGRLQDLRTIAGDIDPALQDWIDNTTRVPAVLLQRPTL